MLGGDVRNMTPFAESLVLNRGLLRVNQDAECRVPQTVYRGRVLNTEYDPETNSWWHEYPDAGLTLFKHMSDHEFAVGYFNFAPKSGDIHFIFADAGLPYGSGCALHFTDAITGEDLGVHQDYFHINLESHACRVLLAKLVKA
jgi:alpha-galactosidase